MCFIIRMHQGVRRYWCKRCRGGCKTSASLNNHKKHCNIKPEELRIEFPKPGSVYKFVDLYKQVSHPYIICGDFEAIQHGSKEEARKYPSGSAFYSILKAFEVCKVLVLDSTTTTSRAKDVLIRRQT